MQGELPVALLAAHKKFCKLGGNGNREKNSQHRFQLPKGLQHHFGTHARPHNELARHGRRPMLQLNQAARPRSRPRLHRGGTALQHTAPPASRGLANPTGKQNELRLASSRPGHAPARCLSRAAPSRPSENQCYCCHHAWGTSLTMNKYAQSFGRTLLLLLRAPWPPQARDGGGEAEVRAPRHPAHQF